MQDLNIKRENRVLEESFLSVYKWSQSIVKDNSSHHRLVKQKDNFFKTSLTSEAPLPEFPSSFFPHP